MSKLEDRANQLRGVVRSWFDEGLIAHLDMNNALGIIDQIIAEDTGSNTTRRIFMSEEDLSKTCRLADVRNGVRWYVRQDGGNANIMIIPPEKGDVEPTIIQGYWVSPRSVFNNLADLPEKQRIAFVAGLLS